MRIQVDPEAKQRLLNRLHRAEGQIQALKRLIAEDADCEVVITQLRAMCAASQAAARCALAELVAACVEHHPQRRDLVRRLVHRLPG